MVRVRGSSNQACGTPKKKIPRHCEWVLRHLLPKRFREEALLEIEEEYIEKCHAIGKAAGVRFVRKEVLNLVGHKVSEHVVFIVGIEGLVKLVRWLTN